eukprot:TRINITY_DN5398_c0_g1_i1.p1 TRINITY_DN5398_c0_g1~~TRINITY_DN5398_c0_g1_i1.p1  ORF type:complete len:368 (-),score=60.68 TRINITY_DN5398_c0_g1_i1:395-1498(-)
MNTDSTKKPVRRLSIHSSRTFQPSTTHTNTTNSDTAQKSDVDSSNVSVKKDSIDAAATHVMKETVDAHQETDATESPQRSNGGSALSLILDINPLFWGRLGSESKETPHELLNCIMTFTRAYLLLNQHNHISFIIAMPSHSKIVYTSLDDEAEEEGPSDASSKKRKRISRHTSILSSSTSLILQAIRSLSQDMKTLREKEMPPGFLDGCALSSALGIGLCFINRAKATRPVTRGRVLCIYASKDIKTQYLSLNNKIFCAEHQKVPIDTCVIGREDSVFLRQCASITDGIYVKLEKYAHFLPYLMSTFSTDPSVRKIFKLPTQVQSEAKPTCLCHEKEIVIGWACPVCLRVCDEVANTCPVCKTRRMI